MKKYLSLALFLLIAMSIPALAKKKHKDGGYDYRIFEVDAVSITVSVGKSGEEHQSYKITDNTKVTLNGLPTPARDLRAGMVAKLVIDPDGTTVDSIDAKDAPAKDGKKRVG